MHKKCKWMLFSFAPCTVHNFSEMKRNKENPFFVLVLHESSLSHYRHNATRAAQFLRPVLGSRQGHRVGMGERLWLLDAVWHGAVRQHPERLREATPLAGPELSGLQLCGGLRRDVPNQPAEPEEAAHPPTDGPGVPSHRRIHPQIPVLAGGHQLRNALLLSAVHAGPQHKGRIQRYPGAAAEEEALRDRGRSHRRRQAEQHLRWLLPLVTRNGRCQGTP